MGPPAGGLGGRTPVREEEGRVSGRESPRAVARSRYSQFTTPRHKFPGALAQKAHQLSWLAPPTCVLAESPTVINGKVKQEGSPIEIEEHVFVGV